MKDASHPSLEVPGRFEEDKCVWAPLAAQRGLISGFSSGLKPLGEIVARLNASNWPVWGTMAPHMY